MNTLNSSCRLPCIYFYEIFLCQTLHLLVITSQTIFCYQNIYKIYALPKTSLETDSIVIFVHVHFRLRSTFIFCVLFFIIMFVIDLKGLFSFKTFRCLFKPLRQAMANHFFVHVPSLC